MKPHAEPIELTRAILKLESGFIQWKRVRCECIRHYSLWFLSWPDRLSRGVDVVIGAVLVLLLLPLLAIRCLVGRAQGGAWLEARPCVGKSGTVIFTHRFAGGAPGARWAQLLDVVRGGLSLTGPPAVERKRSEADGAWDSTRFAVRPGLVSPFGVRRRLGIAYQDELTSQKDYVLERSLASDLGLLLRALPGLFLQSFTGRHGEERVRLLGVEIDNLAIDSAVETITGNARDGRSLRVSFVNPDCLNIACRHREYRQTLATSDLVLGDGIGVQLAGRLLRTPLRANLNGTDLFPLLCRRAAELGLPVYLLGAEPGVAGRVADQMRGRFPELVIAGHHHGYFTPEEEPAVIERVRDSGARLLLVAMGAPRQELWSSQHHHSLGCPVVIGVGGLFDFYSGRTPRAPAAWRELGLEWLWRLRCEPTRLWKRYVVGNPLFLIRVALQRCGHSFAVH